MADTLIYGPQNWTAGAISEAGAYHSSTFGGSDAPVSGYPELGTAENVHTVAAAGPSGENVIDAVNTADYTTAGFQLLKLGSLNANGDFDVRDIGNGAFRARVKIKLLASALNESGHLVPFSLVGGGMTDQGGQSNTYWFALIEMFQTSGANFQWDVSYWAKSGASFISVDLNPLQTLAAGVADDAWHKLELEIIPATVTGAFTVGGGVGHPGSATIANDGSLVFRVDDVIVLSVSNVGLVVNRLGTANPDVYYGRGVWFGDGTIGEGADMAGPVTGIQLSYHSATTTRPTPTMAVPIPCCCRDCQEKRANGEGMAGPMLAAVSPRWIPRCTGGGTVPTQADIVNSEDWSV